MEGLGMLVGSGDKSLNGGAELIFAGETGAAKCFSCRETKPDFDLVQPTGGGWGEMELNSSSIPGQPVLIPLVRTVVVQDDVNLFVHGVEINCQV
jgi:hypothetical protein